MAVPHCQPAPPWRTTRVSPSSPVDLRSCCFSQCSPHWRLHAYMSKLSGSLAQPLLNGHLLSCAKSPYLGVRVGWADLEESGHDTEVCALRQVRRYRKLT